MLTQARAMIEAGMVDMGNREASEIQLGVRAAKPKCWVAMVSVSSPLATDSDILIDKIVLSM